MKKSLIALCAIFVLYSLALSKEESSPAPAFNGKTPDGEVIKLADYKGKVVLLDFWASWCGPCREEMPFLIQLHEKVRKNGFTVIGVNVDTEVEKAEGFLNQLGQRPSFPVVFDPEGKIPPLYAVSGMPTTVLIDKHGVIRFRHTGFKEADKEKLVEEVKTLLQE